ncbi:hypothetical protein WSM22_01670 [Cytophagales bacterium WSM2-2]|nr:hypothetical protein WSM22_01670 [Cytophagales bacterium WSM2-2]
MKRFLTYLLVLLPGLANAQTFSYELWHDGKVVLETGDTIRGNIKYDLQDMLQVKHDNRLESFSARKAVFYEIFDAVYKRYRHFYSLPFAVTGAYKTPTFFEVLTEGKITVLSRERIEYRTYSSPFFYGGYSSRMVLVNMFYLLKENGNIEEFAGKKNDWYDLMKNRENDVREYVRENKLDFDRKYQLKQIIDYYNSFFNSK